MSQSQANVMIRVEASGIKTLEDLGGVVQQMFDLAEASQTYEAEVEISGGQSSTSALLTAEWNATPTPLEGAEDAESPA